MIAIEEVSRAFRLYRPVLWAHSNLCINSNRTLGQHEQKGGNICPKLFTGGTFPVGLAHDEPGAAPT